MRSLAPLAAGAALALALTSARLCAAPAEAASAASAAAAPAAAAASAPIARPRRPMSSPRRTPSPGSTASCPPRCAHARTPGAVVVIVKDGQVLLEKGYGYADEDKRTPVDPARTLFRPGSTSKLFTWTSVMQLVEQGKLDLDTGRQQVPRLPGAAARTGSRSRCARS